MLEEDLTLPKDNSDAVAGSGYSYWKTMRRCWKIIWMQLLEKDPTLLEDNSDAVTRRGSDIAGK